MMKQKASRISVGARSEAPQGPARVDTRTMRLLLRLRPGEIAIISHHDLDGPCALGLLERGVRAVVNAEPSMSGRFPNTGPGLLLKAGVCILDSVGPQVMKKVAEGDIVRIEGDALLRGDEVIAKGERLTLERVQERMQEASSNLRAQLTQFVRNTLSYIEREGAMLYEAAQVPALGASLRGRHVLVVVRGEGAAQDLTTIRSYVRDVKPVLVGVDGGADILLRAGLRPDVIMGDMDSASDDALRCGAELVVHAYAGAGGHDRAPGLERLKRLGLEAKVFPCTGTSEDAAMILAHEKGAELIVAVGTHFGLVDFLERARGGMASTFLTRLKLGSALVDAKGVNRLYRPAPGSAYLLGLAAISLLTAAVVYMVSPEVRGYLSAILLRIRLSIGI